MLTKMTNTNLYNNNNHLFQTIHIHTCIQYVHRVILFIIMVLKKPLYGVRLKMHGVAVQGT